MNDERDGLRRGTGEGVVYTVWRTASAADRTKLVERLRASAPATAARSGFVRMSVSECRDDGRVPVEGRWTSRDAFEAAAADDPDARAERRALECLGTGERGHFTPVFDVGPNAGSADELPDDRAFRDRFERREIATNGVRLGVLVGGEGETVLLIPGFFGTWAIWRRVMPILAERHRVIAPDLRGFGASDGSAGGYDKRTLALDMAGLLDALEVERCHVVGHGMGGRVGYRLSVAERARVASLAVVETLLPGVEIRGTLDEGRFWHLPLRLAVDAPELLLPGSERAYVAAMTSVLLDRRHEMMIEDRRRMAAAFARPRAPARAPELYRTQSADIEDFGPCYRESLGVPVLALGGERSLGERVLESFEMVADDVRGGTMEGCFHLVPMERSGELGARLEAFLDTCSATG